MMKLKTLPIIFFLFCSSAFGVHIGEVTIKRVRVFDTFALVTPNEGINTPSCAERNDHFMIPLDESRSANRMYSTVLAAHAQQAVVNPNCTQCDSSTWLGSITKCSEMLIK